MNIRKQTEEIELKTLHPGAAFSVGSKGRVRKEREGEIRTCYQRDRDRIIHSKSFRRLKHKAQFFLAPRGDHHRTRITHVLEVSQIARTISRALRLNEDLAEAIALGHDLGHTPFGHAGESVLRDIHPGGFDHYKQSLRVIDVLEREGRGLNLTYEVRDGIVTHSKGKGKIIPQKKEGLAETLEGQIVRVSDIIAYVNHDLDDAMRAGVIKKQDIPKYVVEVLGSKYSRRVDIMVKAVIGRTMETGYDKIDMNEDVSSAIYELRDFLYDRVYESEEIKREFIKAKKILEDLYAYFLEHTDEVSKDTPSENKADRHRVVCDFIAGMTDRFALLTFERLFMPQEWQPL